MITIKIRDRRWFKEHCVVTRAYGNTYDVIPKYSPWKKELPLPWYTNDSMMTLLEGQVLEVKYDAGNEAGNITNARYFAGNFWIPNWAIEWVKEEI